MILRNLEYGKEHTRMDQSFINWLLGGVSGLLGALGSLIFIGMRDLQRAQSRTDRRLSEIEVLVAGD